MEAILSSSFKNNNTRFIEFLPEIDSVPSFGFIGDNSLDGTGVKREQADADIQADEPQPATQIALPSGSSLADKLVPEGIGTLEQMSYHGRKKEEPQVAAFSYPFFDRQPRHFLPDANPRYPLYAYLALRKSFPYIGRYKTIAPVAEYFAEKAYEPIEQSKAYSYVANYPLVHIVLLEQFDPQKESYNRASLFAPRLKVPTHFYGNYAQYFHTNAKPLSIEQPKPVEIAATFTKLLYPITLLNQQTHVAQPESEKDKLTDKFLKTPPQIQETKPTQKISFETPGTNPIPQNPATLEANVRNIYKLQSTPRHEIYNANPSHQIQISLPHNPIQQAQTPEPRIESRLMKSQTQTRTHEKPKTEMLYGPNQSYPSIEFWSKNNKQVAYIAPMQPKPTPKDYGHSVQRNYDTQPQWLNVMDSKLWTSAIGKKYSVAKKSAKYDPKKNNAKIKSSAKDEKSEYKEKPDYKKGTQVEYRKISEDDLKYKTQEKTEIPEAVSQTMKNYQPDRGKKYTKKKPSLLTYAGVVAGIGLLGLANLASAFFDKPREVKKSYSYQVTNYNTEEPKRSETKTIDSVVEPVAASVPSVDKKIIFTPDFINDLVSWKKAQEKLGYKNVRISITKNSTGEHYGDGDEEPDSTPSWNKVPLIIVADYLAQKGLFDPKRPITYRRELVLERETEHYKEYNGNVKRFSYDELQHPVIRSSLNTPTNFILYALGRNIDEPEEVQLKREEAQTKEEVAAQIRRGIDRANEILTELGIPETKIKAPYLNKEKLLPLGFNEDDYLLNVSTPKASARAMSIVSEGEHIGPEYLNSLKDDLQNEVHGMGLRRLFPGIKSETKFTMHKRGIGVISNLDDISLAVLLSNPKDLKQELYTDDARDATDIRRVANPIFWASHLAFEDLFGNILTNYILNNSYKKTA